MTVRGKEELKEFFRTGEIPTGEKFADFIDSYIASINGSMPDESGNVEVPIPFTVNPEIAVDDLPSAYPLGRTIGTFNYVPGENDYLDSLLEEFDVPETTITVITDRFGENGESIVIQQIDIMQDGAFVPTLTRSSNIEQTEWRPLQFIASVRKINGQTPDLNGEINIDSGPQGPQGEQGPVGPQGPIGPQGEQGEQGERGPAGPMGPQGELGPEGPVGPVGPQGMQGERGEKGERGQGLDIKASYQTVAAGNADIANIADSTFVYISNDENNDNRGSVYFKHEGATTLEFQFVAEGIKGDKGEPGERGEQGPMGPQGPQGPQGPRGIQGVQGIQGARGPEGPPGSNDDASTTTKGVVQIGDGLSVTDGVISVAPKDYFHALGSSATVVAVGNPIYFSTSRVVSRGITITDNNVIHLKGGKVYKIDFGIGIGFTLTGSSSNGFVGFKPGTSSGNYIANGQTINIKSGSVYNNGQSPVLGIIYAPEQDTTFGIFCNQISSNTTAAVRVSETFITIIEI